MGGWGRRMASTAADRRIPAPMQARRRDSSDQTPPTSMDFGRKEEARFSARQRHDATAARLLLQGRLQPYLH